MINALLYVCTFKWIYFWTLLHYFQDTGGIEAQEQQCCQNWWKMFPTALRSTFMHVLGLSFWEAHVEQRAQGELIRRCVGDLTTARWIRLMGLLLCGAEWHMTSAHCHRTNTPSPHPSQHLRYRERKHAVQFNDNGPKMFVHTKYIFGRK